MAKSEVNRTFEELGRHYGLAVLPARPRKPKDKAKVERAVQVVQRWVLARLRDRVFTSLPELNEAIAELVAVINAKPMRLLNKSREQLWKELDWCRFRRFQPSGKSVPRRRSDWYQLSSLYQRPGRHISGDQPSDAGLGFYHCDDQCRTHERWQVHRGFRPSGIVSTSRGVQRCHNRVKLWLWHNRVSRRSCMGPGDWAWNAGLPCAARPISESSMSFEAEHVINESVHYVS